MEKKGDSLLALWQQPAGSNRFVKGGRPRCLFRQGRGPPTTISRAPEKPAMTWLNYIRSPWCSSFGEGRGPIDPENLSLFCARSPADSADRWILKTWVLCWVQIFLKYSEKEDPWWKTMLRMPTKAPTKNASPHVCRVFGCFGLVPAEVEEPYRLSYRYPW